MEINVASAIEELLDRRESVTIIGLGSLRLENLSAKISDDGKLISPPKAKLAFFEVQTDNAPLRKYISYKYDLSKKDANKAIKKYSQSVLNTLANYGQVQMEGIAKIKSKGGKYKVKALDSFKSKYYKGLPTLPISKLKSKELPKDIKKTTEPKPAPVSEVKSATADKVKKSALAKSKESAKATTQAKSASKKTPETKPMLKEKLIATTATAAAIKAPIVTSKKVIENIKKDEVVTKPKSSAPLTLNEKLGINTDKSATTLKNQSTTINTTSQQPYIQVPPKKESFGCLGPFLGILGIVLLCFFLWKGFQCIYNTDSGKTSTTEKLVDGAKEGVTSATGKVAEVGSSIKDKAEKIANSNEEENNNASDQKSSDVTDYNPETCIIIIGSYSNYQNVNRSERILVDRGYKPYIEEYGPYTRVGFEFDCADENLPNYLKEIRASIEARAWYLKPDLHVEY